MLVYRWFHLLHECVVDLICMLRRSCECLAWFYCSPLNCNICRWLLCAAWCTNQWILLSCSMNYWSNGMGPWRDLWSPRICWRLSALVSQQHMWRFTPATSKLFGHTRTCLLVCLFELEYIHWLTGRYHHVWIVKDVICFDVLFHMFFLHWFIFAIGLWTCDTISGS